MSRRTVAKTKELLSERVRALEKNVPRLMQTLGREVEARQKLAQHIALLDRQVLDLTERTEKLLELHERVHANVAQSLRLSDARHAHLIERVERLERQVRLDEGSLMGVAVAGIAAAAGVELPNGGGQGEQERSDEGQAAPIRGADETPPGEDSGELGELDRGAGGSDGELDD